MTATLHVLPIKMLHIVSTCENCENEWHLELTAHEFRTELKEKISICPFCKEIAVTYAEGFDING